ncbi:hypothetical protein Tco_1276583, partial [Tanacetum coccineum]
MITTDSRIEDKKPSELILPPMDILETFPCVKDVDYITRDLAVSSVSYKELNASFSAKELEDDGVLEIVEHLRVICFKILAVLDAFLRGILTFVLTFPIGNLGFLTVDSVATVFLWDVTTDWSTFRLGSL